MWKYAKRKLLIGALKSDYAKRSYDFLPTWLISYILRLFVDFMLYYRLRVPVEQLVHGWGLYVGNFCIAVVISVFVTMCSPFFYDIVWQYEEHIKKFTNHVADHMSWDYFYVWQTRIVVMLALLCIIIFSYVEITSIWLIECIIHTLICGFVLSKYEELREYISKPRIVHCEYVNMRANVKNIYSVPSACKQVHHSYHDSEWIEDYQKPKKAIVVNTDVLKQKQTTIIVNNVHINIFTDYCGRN